MTNEILEEKIALGSMFYKVRAHDIWAKIWQEGSIRAVSISYVNRIEIAGKFHNPLGSVDSSLTFNISPTRW